MDLSARTVLVTGATGGSAGPGCRVARPRCRRLRRRPRSRPGRPAGRQGDRARHHRPSSVAAAAQAAGDVTVLINNAGSSTGSDLLAGDLNGIRLEMDTHYFGTLSVVRGFAPQIAANGGRAILNVLSGFPGSASRRSAPTAPPSPRSGRSPTPCACSSPGRTSGLPDSTSATWTRTWPVGHRAKVRPRRHRPDRRRRHRRRRVRDPRRQRRPPGAGRAGRRRLSALPATALRIGGPEVLAPSAGALPQAVQLSSRRSYPGSVPGALLATGALSSATR